MPRRSVLGLAAQAVPSSAMLPCIAALPSGWTAAGGDITSGRSVFWLDSDQAGARTVGRPRPDGWGPLPVVAGRL